MRLNQFLENYCIWCSRWFIHRLTWYLEELLGIVPDSTASLVKGRHDHQRTATALSQAQLHSIFSKIWNSVFKLRDALLHREYWFSLGKLGVRHLPYLKIIAGTMGNFKYLRSCSIVNSIWRNDFRGTQSIVLLPVKILPWNFSIPASRLWRSCFLINQSAKG